jgi:hypothetical protein
MLHYLGRVHRGGGHEEAVLGEPGGGAVVHHDPVLAQHHAVARLADRQGGEHVDVKPVKQRPASGP